MRFAAVATLAFVGAVAAQNSTTTATGCVAKDNACRTTRMPDGSSANQAQCSANNAQCQGDCYAAYNTCRTTPVDGLSANQAQCVSEYATCLGENPVAASGGLISSFIPYSATASSSAASATTAAASASASASAGSNCVAKDNACRTTRMPDGSSANQAQCSANNAQCQGDCYAAYNTCRTTPVDGLSANQAQCVSEYATCLGENPVAASGGLISSFIPYSATASSSAASATTAAASASASASAGSNCVAKDNACRTTRMPDGSSANQAQCSANNAQCQGDCYAAYNTCRTTPVDGLSANQAQCVSEYATCLGENPVASSGGIISSFIPYTATASSSASMVYMTEVVTALTTVCPAPTAGAYTTTIHSNVYTVSSATTITVTNCPCTVSSKVPVASVTGGAQGGMMTSAAGNGGKNGTATATQSKPAVYTGAAANVAAGMGFLGAAAGAVMLL